MLLYLQVIYFMHFKFQVPLSFISIYISYNLFMFQVLLTLFTWAISCGCIYYLFVLILFVVLRSWLTLTQLSPWLYACLIYYYYCWCLMIASKFTSRDIFIWYIGRNWRLLAIGLLTWIFWLSLFDVMAFI